MPSTHTVVDSGSQVFDPARMYPDLKFVFDQATGLWAAARADAGIPYAGMMIFDTGTLQWRRATPADFAGGGGVGGAVTIADGADVAEGATADPDTANTVIGRLKKLVGLLTGTLTVTGPLTDVQLRALAVPTDPSDRDARVVGRVKLHDGTDVALISAAGELATQFLSAQPVTANAGTNLNTSALALAATQADGTQKAITRGGAKGATAAADVTSTAQGADHQSLDVQIYHGGAAKDPTQIRALTATDVVSGGYGNNVGSVGTAAMGGIIAVANEAFAAYTEGRAVMPAVDLRGVLRAIGVPMANLGVFEVMWKSGTYAGLAANTPLFSFRWGDATRFMILLRLQLMVINSVAATTAGITERQLIIARSFTASDTAGTSFLPATNSAKRRTSMGTTLLTDMRAGAPITAGTRTLDANPISSVAGWSGLLSTGLVIGASSGSAVGAARSTEGGTGMIDLYNSLNGQDHPQTFAQNEGAVVRIGAAQPAGSTQETWGTMLWLEANKVF